MSDGRDARALSSLDVDHVEHVARGVVTGRVRQVEELLRPLHQHRRSERPERLAKLDLGVDDVLHARVSRVGQDAPVAEGARSQLEPSLEPADHLAGLQVLDDPCHQPVVILVPGMRDVVGPDEGVHVADAVLLTPVGVAHDEVAGLTEDHVVPDQGRAHRAAAVAGRRLDEQFLERRLAQDATVGDAVERHAARQAEALEPRLAMEV